jgi:flagellar biosynthesis component FlhA
MGEGAQTTKNPVLLTEYVRQFIRRAITKPLLSPQGELPAYLLDPALERAIEVTVEHGEWNSAANLAPETLRDILAKMSRHIDKAEPAVMITGSAVRHFVRQIVEATLPGLVVLSHNEIAPEIRVRSRGVVA